tara:strand:+ start:1816 stop:2025 length:210 start_codon:yes stop_codon:yes gene_type:complete
MVEKKICENQHKMIIDWESGFIADRACTNIATKYTIDNFGIFYLCEECYKEDCKRRTDSEWLSISKEDV